MRQHFMNSLPDFELQNLIAKVLMIFKDYLLSNQDELSLEIYNFLLSDQNDQQSTIRTWLNEINRENHWITSIKGKSVLLDGKIYDSSIHSTDFIWIDLNQNSITTEVKVFS